MIYFLNYINRTLEPNPYFTQTKLTTVSTKYTEPLLKIWATVSVMIYFLNYINRTLEPNPYFTQTKLTTVATKYTEPLLKVWATVSVKGVEVWCILWQLYSVWHTYLLTYTSLDINRIKILWSLSQHTFLFNRNRLYGRLIKSSLQWVNMVFLE